LAFPPIRWCVMCEDARIENRRQVSLLGFYGVTPDVEIAISDFNQPIERLAFYLWTQGESDGRTHKLTFEVLDPEQNRIIGPITTSPEGVAPRAHAPITFGVIFTAGNLPLRLPGRYQIVVRIDADESRYETSFVVRQARLADIAP